MTIKSLDLQLVHKVKPVNFQAQSKVPQINDLLDGGFQSGTFYYYSKSNENEELINLVYPDIDPKHDFNILILKDQKLMSMSQLLDELLVQQNIHPRPYIVQALNLTDDSEENLSSIYQCHLQLLFRKLKALANYGHILVLASNSGKTTVNIPNYVNLLGSLYADVFLFNQESPRFNKYWLLKHPDKPVRCIIKKKADSLIRNSPTSKCSCSRPLQNIALIPFHSQLVDSVPPNR